MDVSTTSAPTSHHRVIIVGSGPAGLTAAIYTSRAELEPLLIEGIESGGQLMLTTEVENYPGFPEGLMGPDMMMRFREQAERFGTQIVTDDVTRLVLDQRPFRVEVGPRSYTADAIILSTGASALQLGIASEQALSGHGVSYCATCDGYFFRDKEIVVVGGGDSAMEEATFLTKFASKVYIVHRRGEYRASKIMLERARANPKIEFIEWATVSEVLGVDAGSVTGVRLRDTRDGTERELACEGVFIAIGHVPNTQLVQGLLELDEQGYIRTFDGSTRTSVEGVFAAGDVQDHVYRQAVTAAGSGCSAAIDTERWLADQAAPAVTHPADGRIAEPA